MKSEIAVVLVGAASPVVDSMQAMTSPGALLLVAGLTGLWLASKRSERWARADFETVRSSAAHPNQENPPSPR